MAGGRRVKERCSSSYPTLLDALAEAKVRVPENLSVVSLSDPRTYSVVSNITCTAFDPLLTQEMAFRLLERLVRLKAETGKVLRNEMVRIAPHWIYRSSVAAQSSRSAASHAPADQIKPAPVSIPGFEVTEDPRRRREHMESLVQRQYELTFGTSETRFEIIPLQPYRPCPGCSLLCRSIELPFQ